MDSNEKPKKIGRPATGPTKTKMSLTIDNDALSKALELATKKYGSMSALATYAIHKLLDEEAKLAEKERTGSRTAPPPSSRKDRPASPRLKNK